MDIIVHGADSETYHGRPMTLQFFSDDLETEEVLWVDEHTATKGFFEWAESLPRHCLNVVYCHNLDFDLPEFLWDVKHELITKAGDFYIELGGWILRGVYGAPTFCKMTHRKSNRSILIVDSHLWFQGTLAKAAELFCPELPKLKRIDGLGTKKFGMKDEAFYNYAMRDSVIAYHIGKGVQELIREFDIMQPVSLADMAAKIFRKHYVNVAHPIPQPGRDCMEGALKSYHGGKNNVVSNAAPGWHMDVTAMDISSAYPFSMAQLPSMSKKKLYRRYKKSVNRNVRSVPPLGVYQCTGVAANCEWPVIFQHAFQPIQGHFKKVWIQGYELNEALRNGEVKLKSVRGFYYEFERDSVPSPFAGYCHEFYDRKQTEKNPVQKYMYKLILNSCYGKFIQTHKHKSYAYTDADTSETVEAHDVVAGGMFHPFIASAITAHTRAYMHQLEHEHNAIHTATDGFYTKYKRIRRVPMMPRGKGLGSIEIEGQGDLVLLRNKCYILYSPKGKLKSDAFKNKRILKFAKHGFMGTVYDLERLVAENRRRYKVNKPNRLKESLKRGLNVNEFVEHNRILKVGKITVRG